MRTRLLLAGTTIVLSGSTLVACGDDGGSSTSAGSKLSITAKEYAFDVSGKAQAGLTTVTFTNNGNEPHIVGAVKLKPGKTVADAVDVIGADEPDEAKMAAVLDEDPEAFHGLPGLALKADKAVTITKELKQGTYALVCFLPSPDGKPHFLQGMAKELTVEAAPSDTPQDPKTKGDIVLTDDAVTLPAKMESGTYRVVNSGKVPHQLNIARAPAGTKVADVDKAFNDYFNAVGKTPTPTVPTFPYDLVGGFTDTLPPGANGYVVLDLSKGFYLVAGDSDDEGNTTISTTFDVK